MKYSFIERIALGCCAFFSLTAMAEDGPAPRVYNPALGLYYDTVAQGKDGDWLFIGAHLSANPLAADEVLRYGVNCVTREYVFVLNQQPASPATPLTNNPPLYAIAEKACGWSNPGLLQKLFGVIDNLFQ